ncbi:MAG: InlB B-repeat-containing protein [Gammaproteobacteria bacterium]|nr:InlB B-repeat-containing protein [Gammaproteobacteria bacterium]
MKAKELMKNPKIKKLWIKCGSILIALFVLLIGLVVVTLVLNNNYKVTYHYNTEYAVEVDNPTKCKKNQTYQLLSPTRIGYEFVGWSDFGGTFFDELSGIKADAIDLYASWSEPYYIVEGTTLKSLTGFGKTKEVLDIPQSFEGMTITTISSDAFQYNTVIKEVTIPKTVTEIKENAFLGCTNLEKVKYEGTAQELANITVSDETINWLDVECSNGTRDGLNKQKVYYTITFETFDGSSIQSVEVEKNGLLSRPNDPVKDKYLFKGWYKNEALTIKYSFAEKVTESFTLYAKFEIDPDQIEKEYVTVRFITNGGTRIDNMSIEKNTKLNLPVDPIRDDYQFYGWFNDNDWTDPFDKNKVVEHDINLYAKWGPITYTQVTVKFVSTGTNYPDTTTTIYGKVERPEDPIRGTDVFNGWYTEATYDNLFDFNTIVTSPITLYAKFSAKTLDNVTITFNTHGGNVIPSIEIPKNSLLKESDVPTPVRDGLSFYAWYTDTSYSSSTELDLSKIVSSDLTLHARWEHLLEYVLDGTGSITGVENTYYVNSIGTANTTDIYISPTFKGKQVLAIKQNAFKGLTNINSITVGGGIEIIGKEAFANSSITSIILPNTVTVIEDGAFEGCTNLTKVVLNDGLEIIEINLFKNSSVIDIVIPSSVKVICDSAINDGTNLYLDFESEEAFLSQVDIDQTINLESMNLYYYRDDLTGLTGNYWSYDGSGNIITA